MLYGRLYAFHYPDNKIRLRFEFEMSQAQACTYLVNIGNFLRMENVRR